MRRNCLSVAFNLVVTALAISLIGCGSTAPGGGGNIELLNVSYDPTRELWRELNETFSEDYRQRTGKRVEIAQSHGGSASQARAVIDGLEADVVTLALLPDTEAVHRAGLINQGWQERLPGNSSPYFSTIVFVVRKGNPQQIKDWPDLVRPDVQVITPSPKTSGNGKLSFLGAWGSVVLRGGSDQAATDFVRKLYRNAPVLESGARGATTAFAQKKLGDVHLTWENEAHLEVAEAKGDLEIVYPSLSIRAEPPVAVVDANVDRRGTRAAAQAYLEFLYTPAAQNVIARHYYRPGDETILTSHADRFPKLELFRIEQIAQSWDDAQAKFFAEGGVFDQIYQPQSK